MKPLYALLICVILSGCGVMAPSPTPTIVPTKTATSTPEPDLTATAQVNQAATQTQARESINATTTHRAIPTVTARAYVDNMLAEITAAAASEVIGVDFSQAKLIFGAASDKLVQKNDKYVEVFRPKLSVQNFIVNITFVNPYSTSTVGLWDYGIFFRSKKDAEYRLVILSDQTWTLIDNWEKSYVNTNSSNMITRNAGEENTIWLIVSGEKAYLFINGAFMKRLNVTQLGSGDIMPTTGNYAGNEKKSKITEFRDFTVWSLP